MRVFRALVSLLALSSVAQAMPPAGSTPQWTPERVFALWDKNADGKLSADEVPRPELFKTLDKNADGFVTKEEIATLSRGGGGTPGAPNKPGADTGKASQWKGLGVSTGAPLPPAENFEPRQHGDEIKRAGLKPEVIAQLDVEMQRHVAAKNVAGISAIIHQNGVRGYFETFGMADIEQGRVMEMDAIFRLMSMTKPVVALAALTLYDEGKLGLDDPIAKYCPEWASPTVQESGAVVPAKHAITPRMLMSHSSGLGYGGGQQVAAMAYQAMTQPGTTLKEFSEAVSKEPLLFQPGAGYNYGLGLDILGRYLEALTGQPLDVILKERLFGPLRMTDTDFYVPAEKLGRLCQIYGQPEPGVLVPGSDVGRVSTKPTLFLGGHGLFGTIGDYERLCLMILNRGELDGVRVLKPETVDLIFENHLKHPTMKYGLGGIVNGAGSYGWGGADGTQFVIDRKNRSFTLFMVQTQHYKAPTYPAFLALANEAAGNASPGADTRGGAPSPSGAGIAHQSRVRNGDEAAKAGLKPEVLAKLDLALQQAVANQEISGVIGLIHRNGERGYFEAFGWQDIEAQLPLRKDALFRLQSMTKPVIVACALTLYDEGLFTLDEPISKHLPEWAEPKVLENGQLVPAKFAITPRMLMSHSSGLYYGDIEKGALSKKGNESTTFTPVATTSRDAKTTLKSFSEGLAKAPLKFHPGTNYQYGHSIDVLGRYIEAVAGKPLDDVLQERLLGPLRMSSTDFWVHPENVGRICQIYKQPRPGVLERGREVGKLTEKPTLFLGGQGLISSTEDYERFCRMMMNRGELDGVRVLEPETVDLMFENQLPESVGQKYGLGGAVDGQGGYSWGGANGTQFWLDRTHQLFAIFMVQTQLYRAPTYGAFRQLVNESAGIVGTRGQGGGGGGGGAAALTRQFQQRDQNGDGGLSRDELPARLFDRLDADGNGVVTVEELGTLRRPE